MESIVVDESPEHSYYGGYLYASLHSGFVSDADSPLPRKLERNEKEFVKIKEKISQPNFKGEEAKTIPPEEAICRFCSNIFEEDNVLKTKCKCTFTLIHKSCAAQWAQRKGNNRCDVCDQDIQYIPVTLSTDHHSSDYTDKKKHKSFFTRFWSFFN